ncbi:MAG TPA: Nif3-like dinuclear metal center hexameric protein [Phaeodactylibacter sp.]|nr:Nif3-like dinuclear metal center hexameric protein [Phaeodactylibacter sp.]
MKIKELTSYLETIAPPAYQESYDNAGLIVGNPNAEITGVLICLDSTEAIIEEAISKKCNVVVAHHPIVFRGLKRFNGKDYVERVVIKAIKNDVAIYAIHTNLDNVYYKGVNAKIAERLGLVKTQILAPKADLKKIFAFVPLEYSEKVRQALFEAGGGSIPKFENLSYATVGVGTQLQNNGAQVKLEMTFPSVKQNAILKALHDSHPYFDVPYDIISIENQNTEVGSGMIGFLKKPMSEKDFLQKIKKKMKTGCIRYTKLRRRKISKVAFCGGAGGFLLKHAIRQGADIFITGDYKYHEFFDADGKIVIADIGHFESEQFTIDLLHEIITEKFTTFAAYLTEVNTNPVNYL